MLRTSKGGREPAFGPWTAMTPIGVMDRLREAVGPAEGVVGVLAVDGRSGGGKTTVAGRLAAAIDACAVVHTDDISWHHSFFDWADLLIEQVLLPVGRGEAVDYRPEAWRERDREGSISVPAPLRWLIVEGVGAARRELAPYIDAVLWVQSDDASARERGIARDGGDAEATSFWDEWMAAEEPFLADHRPWERAHLVINGTPPAGTDQAGILIAPAG
jgi:uridine kinase